MGDALLQLHEEENFTVLAAKLGETPGNLRKIASMHRARLAKESAEKNGQELSEL